MSRVLACLVALFLVPSSTSAQGVVGRFINGVVVGPPNGQPPRDVRPVTGRSTLRGRIVAADGGQPMRRVIVRVTAPELRGARTVLTDVDGRYEFRELPAGRYSISASKPPFVSWSYGQTQPAGPGKPLVIADNQTAESIDIRLPRGSVITGRVTDDFGEPAPGANVMLMRSQFSQGQRRLVQTGGRASTNDIGEYRIFGLAPGQYYVSATVAQGMIGGGGVEGEETRSGYSPTFYPGTAEMTSAQKLTLATAQTLSDIDFALVPTRLATISGVAVDSEGRPFAVGFVSIMPRGGMISFGAGGGPLRPDGTFTVPNVSPGEYLLRANAPQPPPAPGTPFEPPVFSIAVVTVNGEDVTGVRLAPVVPVTISGRVFFDDQRAAQSLKPSAIRIVGQALSPDDAAMGVGGAPGRPSPTVQDDFTFELKTAAGRIALRAIIPSTSATPTEWQVKAIRVNATDVTDSGIDVGSQGVRGVEIELTNRLQQISGMVTDARGGAVNDYVVVLFAQDRTRWSAASNRYVAIGRPADEGRFKVATLPPGEYYGIALDRADPTEWQDPEFLEGLSRQASTFSLAQGETKTLALRLFRLQ